MAASRPKPAWMVPAKPTKKEPTNYGVFMHIPNLNGFVVRTVYQFPDGKWHGMNPYNNSTPAGGKIFKQEKAAQRYADALNQSQGYTH